MQHKIEAIDYLRGLSILAIIVVHVLAWHDISVLTEYTRVPALFNLRDVLQFSVVTIVICSGFSLYMKHQKIKNINSFYTHRLKRLLFPWWIFLAVFFSVHLIIKFIFKTELIELSQDYVLSSFLMMGGIGIGWLILLILTLTVLYPLLKYLYDNVNKRLLFSLSAIFYLISIFVFNINPIAIHEMRFDISIIPLAITFIIGWSIVYMIGFSLEQFYNYHPSIKKELRLTFGFVALYFLVRIVHNIFNLNKQLYLNKYPPSPYYLTFGLAITFVLLSLFFSYKHFIHAHLKKLLAFFSSNSYWLFMWNALTLSFTIPFLAMFEFNIYFKLIIAIVLNVAGVTLLVKLQKKLIKIEMHLEKHHF
ncbi:acyltransferase [Candidatus Woesearchaeota archaeon]|nr:acyltransferase [Candidatus Woesearchaeota archaeon]